MLADALQRAPNVKEEATVNDIEILYNFIHIAPLIYDNDELLGCSVRASKNIWSENAKEWVKLKMPFPFSVSDNIYIFEKKTFFVSEAKYTVLEIEITSNCGITILVWEKHVKIYQYIPDS